MEESGTAGGGENVSRARAVLTTCMGKAFFFFFLLQQRCVKEICRKLDNACKEP